MCMLRCLKQKALCPHCKCSAKLSTPERLGDIKNKKEVQNALGQFSSAGQAWAHCQ